jgi:hypothetical protein
MTSACFGTSAVMVDEAKKVTPTDLTISEQKGTKTTLDATPATKKVCLGLANPAKTMVISDNLMRNRSSSSPVSSGTTLTYLHGPRRICQVFQGGWLSTPSM